MSLKQTEESGIVGYKKAGLPKASASTWDQLFIRLYLFDNISSVVRCVDSLPTWTLLELKLPPLSLRKC